MGRWQEEIRGWRGQDRGSGRTPGFVLSFRSHLPPGRGARCPACSLVPVSRAPALASASQECPAAGSEFGPGVLRKREGGVGSERRLGKEYEQEERTGKVRC